MGEGRRGWPFSAALYKITASATSPLWPFPASLSLAPPLASMAVFYSLSVLQNPGPGTVPGTSDPLTKHLPLGGWMGG